MREEYTLDWSQCKVFLVLFCDIEMAYFGEFWGAIQKYIIILAVYFRWRPVTKILGDVPPVFDASATIHVPQWMSRL